MDGRRLVLVKGIISLADVVFRERWVSDSCRLIITVLFVDKSSSAEFFWNLFMQALPGSNFFNALSNCCYILSVSILSPPLTYSFICRHTTQKITIGGERWTAALSSWRCSPSLRIVCVVVRAPLSDIQINNKLESSEFQNLALQAFLVCLRSRPIKTNSHILEGRQGPPSLHQVVGPCHSIRLVLSHNNFICRISMARSWDETQSSSSKSTKYCHHFSTLLWAGIWANQKLRVKYSLL